MSQVGTQRGGWHREDAGHHQQLTQNQVLSVMARANLRLSSTVRTSRVKQTRSRLLKLPEELIKSIMKFLSDDPDALRTLSRVGDMMLRCIAIDILLKTNKDTRASALYWACMAGDMDLMQATLLRGATAEEPFWQLYTRLSDQLHPYAHTPLTAAIAYCRFDFVQTLIHKHGADVNAISFNHLAGPEEYANCTPIQVAFFCEAPRAERIRLVQLLLHHGVDVDHPDTPSFIDAEHMPICLALQDDDLPPSLFRGMLKLSESFEAPKQTNIIMYEIHNPYTYFQGFVKLHSYATSHTGGEIGYFGGDWDTGEEFSPIKMQKLRILRDVTFRLQSDVKIDGRRVNFITTILLARMGWTKKRQLLQLMLAGTPITSDLDTHSDYPLILRVVNGLVTTARKQLRSTKQHADIFHGIQMLLDANAAAGRSLVDGGRPRDIPLPFHEDERKGLCSTVLACLCLPGYAPSFQVEKIMDFLIWRGVRVNDTDYHGLTPLHFAAKYAQTRQARYLIRYGAYVHAADNHGLTALHFVCRIDAPVNRTDALPYPSAASNDDPWASLKERAYIARLLLERGADPVAADAGGYTPLHYACQSGFLDLVRLLLGAVARRRVTVAGFLDEGAGAYQAAAGDLAAAASAVAFVDGSTPSDCLRRVPEQLLLLHNARGQLRARRPAVHALGRRWGKHLIELLLVGVRVIASFGYEHLQGPLVRALMDGDLNSLGTTVLSV